MTPRGTAAAGAGAFPAESFVLFFADGKALHLLCRFAPLRMPLNEACFASAFSFLALLLNSVCHSWDKRINTWIP